MVEAREGKAEREREAAEAESLVGAEGGLEGEEDGLEAAGEEERTEGSVPQVHLLRVTR